jgi:hypothetical protein
MPTAEFKREVVKHLTGKDEEPWEMLYFKVYKSQLAVIEQALETASLMLGGQKSRGYCLENDLRRLFGGSKFGRSKPEDAIQSNSPVRRPSPNTGQARPADGHTRVRVSSIQPKRPRTRLKTDCYRALCRKVIERDGWRCQQSGCVRELEVHHIRFRSALGDDDLENLISLCSSCHRAAHRS